MKNIIPVSFLPVGIVTLAGMSVLLEYIIEGVCHEWAYDYMRAVRRLWRVWIIDICRFSPPRGEVTGNWLAPSAAVNQTLLRAPVGCASGEARLNEENFIAAASLLVG